MKSFEPRIEWRNPNALTPYSNNVKTCPREQLDKVAASIASFGFDQRCGVNAAIRGSPHGNVIAGTSCFSVKRPDEENTRFVLVSADRTMTLPALVNGALFAAMR